MIRIARKMRRRKKMLRNVRHSKPQNYLCVNCVFIEQTKKTDKKTGGSMKQQK